VKPTLNFEDDEIEELVPKTPQILTVVQPQVNEEDQREALNVFETSENEISLDSIDSG